MMTLTSVTKEEVEMLTMEIVTNLTYLFKYTDTDPKTYV